MRLAALPRELCVRAALSLVAVVGAAGCAAPRGVARSYDGHVVIGRYIEPAAYAEFLNAAIAEAAGKPAEALAGYAEALRIDPDGAEIWARIAALRCAEASGDALADEAVSQALALDDGLAQAWAAKAACALARGDGAAARASAKRAADLDPAADRANVLVAQTAEASRLVQARGVLLALTVTAKDRVMAWEALAEWADVHGDVALRALSLRRLVRIAPERRAEAARAAEALARAGQLGEARAVAAAAADASDAPLPEKGYPLAARLAVDEAIAGGDAARVRERATRVRVTLEEAAARALLAGDARLSRDIAAGALGADSADAGIRLVLAVANRQNVLAAIGEARRVQRPVSGAAWVALGEALVFALPPPEVRDRLASVAHDPIVAGDDFVARRRLAPL